MLTYLCFPKDRALNGHSRQKRGLIRMLFDQWSDYLLFLLGVGPSLLIVGGVIYWLLKADALEVKVRR